MLGRWGEAAVAQYLHQRGFALVAAGWRCRFGEIDLIVKDSRYLAFVEVKLRKSADFAQAREFVDRHKQERLRISAELYLAEHPTSLQPRFDVAEVYAPQGVATERPDIRYWENAF